MLSHYRRISAISSRMLEAARRGDWDGLIAAEQSCKAEIDALRAEGEQALAPDEAQEKRRIITKLLADDAEIRDLAQPWMKRLQDTLSAAGNERRLYESYGGAA